MVIYDMIITIESDSMVLLGLCQAVQQLAGMWVHLIKSYEA